MNERIVNVEFNLGPDKGGSGRKGEEIVDFEAMASSPLREARERIMKKVMALELLGGSLPDQERILMLPGDEFVNSLQKNGVDLNTPEGREVAVAFGKWCKGYVDTTERNNKENELSQKQEAEIIQFCLDQVFLEGKSSPPDILKLISDTVLKDRGGTIPESLLRKIESLQIHDWAAVREIGNEWSRFKNTDEITQIPRSLFFSRRTEQSLANGKCFLPYTEKGKTVLKKVDLGDEIGKAMMKLRFYFEGRVGKDGRVSSDAVHGKKEYWNYVGSDLAQKEQLYSLLGINRYVGEAAFSFLLSYQMLTDLSADDYMLMMVEQARKRVSSYKVNENKDGVVRMTAWRRLLHEQSLFTRPSNDDFVRAREELIFEIEKVLPALLIPTGLSFERGEGMKQLREGNWLKWRASEDGYFSRGQYDNADSQERRPATDPDTRHEMMIKTLTILTAIKEIQKPETSYVALYGMTSKLFSLAKSSYGDNGWLEKDDFGKLYVPAEFSPRNAEGVRQKMELTEWISRYMLTITQTYIFTHSIIDQKCLTPKNMYELADIVEQVWSIDPQSENQAILGMNERTRMEHFRGLLSFLEDFEITADAILAAKPQVNSGNGPSYWDSKSLVIGEQQKAIISSSGYKGKFGDKLRTLRRIIEE